MNLQLLCDEAIARHGSGDVDEAERISRQVLAADPRNLTAAYLLAVVPFQKGRSDEALERVGSALKAHPKSAQLHTLKGLALQALGRPQPALASLNKALAANPAHGEALFHRAILLGQLGQPQAALRDYDRLLAANPRHAAGHYNRGVVLGDLGRHEDAVASFDAALAVSPDFAQAWSNRAFSLQQLRRLDEALASAERAVALQPEFAEAWVNRGVVLRDLGRARDALESFRTALAHAPEFAEAWNNLGFIQQHLRALDDAIGSFRRALEIRPDYAEALFNLGSALCESRRTDEGFAMFTRHAELAFGDPAAVGAAAAAPAHKKRHDAEQRDYIAAEAGRQARSTAPLRLVHGERVAGPAVNASRAMGEIDRSWETSRPQIAVIDDLLTPEALERLRRFCWGSTIWRRVYDGGYLGAMPEHGFAAPLLAQIADEMREALPTILKDHPLNYLWAFKYDASLGGIKLHADRAAVNVNFWITPDEANLDPESGGLVVWDAAAPLDWDFERYNDDPEASRAFLAAAKARPIKTPYRSNRAVIFDSDLFHETDAIAFKPGYLNRRINVTMLFGRRSSENR